MTETIVYGYEYDILREMDNIYCEEMNKELADYQERMKEKHAKDLEDSRKNNK